MKVKNIMDGTRKFRYKGKWVYVEAGDSVEVDKIIDDPSFEMQGEEKPTKKKTKKTKEDDSP